MRQLINKFVDIDDNDIQSVIRTLKGRRLHGNAPIVQEYEQQLAEFFEVDYAVTCSSGTAAIHLALLALGIGLNDQVVVPPTAPVMTALPVVAVGATPIFVDTESSHNFGFSIADLEQKITSKTKAIITVPMWGYPIEMDDIIDIGKKKRIPIIEDCSQAHGTKIGNKYLGTFGDLGIFSTHDRKMICTGEGAYILTNNNNLSERMKEMRYFGGQFGVKFGLNFKINALGAALGCSQLMKLHKRIKIRTDNSLYLKRGFLPFSWIEEIPVKSDTSPNYYGFVLHMKGDMEGDAVKFARYLNEYGIISDTYAYNYMPLYDMPIFVDYNRHCHNAEYLCKNIVALPAHEGLIVDDLDYIINTIAKYDRK